MDSEYHRARRWGQNQNPENRERRNKTRSNNWWTLAPVLVENSATNASRLGPFACYGFGPQPIKKSGPRPSMVPGAESNSTAEILR